MFCSGEGVACSAFASRLTVGCWWWVINWGLLAIREEPTEVGAIYCGVLRSWGDVDWFVVGC